MTAGPPKRGARLGCRHHSATGEHYTQREADRAGDRQGSKRLVADECRYLVDGLATLVRDGLASTACGSRNGGRCSTCGLSGLSGHPAHRIRHTARAIAVIPGGARCAGLTGYRAVFAVRCEGRARFLLSSILFLQLPCAVTTRCGVGGRMAGQLAR